MIRPICFILLGVGMFALSGCENTGSNLPPTTVRLNRLPPPPVYMPARASLQYNDMAPPSITDPRPLASAGKIVGPSTPDYQVFPVSRDRGNIAVRKGAGVPVLVIEENASEWSTIRGRVANVTSSEMIVDIICVPHDHRNAEIAEWRSGYQRVVLPPEQYVDVSFHLPSRHTRFFSFLVR